MSDIDYTAMEEQMLEEENLLEDRNKWYRYQLIKENPATHAMLKKAWKIKTSELEFKNGKVTECVGSSSTEYRFEYLDEVIVGFIEDTASIQIITCQGEAYEKLNKALEGIEEDFRLGDYDLGD